MKIKSFSQKFLFLSILMLEIVFFPKKVFANRDFYFIHSTNVESAQKIIRNKKLTSSALQNGFYLDSQTGQILDKDGNIQDNGNFEIGKMKTGVFFQAFTMEQLHQQEEFFQSKEDADTGMNPNYRYLWSWNEGIAFVFSSEIIEATQNKEACHWSKGWLSGRFVEGLSINTFGKSSKEIERFTKENLIGSDNNFEVNELVIQNQFLFEDSKSLLFILIDPYKNNVKDVTEKLRFLLAENNLNVPIYIPNNLKPNCEN